MQTTPHASTLNQCKLLASGGLASVGMAYWSDVASISRSINRINYTGATFTGGESLRKIYFEPDGATYTITEIDDEEQGRYYEAAITLTLKVGIAEITTWMRTLRNRPLLIEATDLTGATMLFGAVAKQAMYLTWSYDGQNPADYANATLTFASKANDMPLIKI